MSKITHYPLTFAENYFISIEGYIFYKGFHLKILPFVKKGNITVSINSKDYSVLNLMLEYFFSEKELTNKTIKVKTEKKHPLRVPKRMIHLENSCGYSLGDKDHFNCASRANTANSRSAESISRADVVRILKRDNYSCQYCGKKINKHNWHLDHIKPLSRKGKNIAGNLCVSCKTCNLMKNSMLKNQFIAKCKSIYKFNKIK